MAHHPRRHSTLRSGDWRDGPPRSSPICAGRQTNGAPNGGCAGRRRGADHRALRPCVQKRDWKCRTRAEYARPILLCSLPSSLPRPPPAPTPHPDPRPAQYPIPAQPRLRSATLACLASGISQSVPVSRTESSTLLVSLLLLLEASWRRTRAGVDDTSMFAPPPLQLGSPNWELPHLEKSPMGPIGEFQLGISIG
eukprot:gene10918-biopygen18348